MKVANDTVVTLTYDICDEQGEIIESSQLSGAVTFLVGTGAIIKGLDKRVIGLEKGDEKTFELPPEEAFGVAADAPTRDIPRGEFPKDAKLDKGLRFEAGTGAPGQKVILEVQDANDDYVTVKMLHPLVGQTIQMSLAVTGVRAATEAELESGRAISAPPPPPPPKK